MEFESEFLTPELAKRHQRLSYLEFRDPSPESLEAKLHQTPGLFPNYIPKQGLNVLVVQNVQTRGNKYTRTRGLAMLVLCSVKPFC